jgi:hypothetical protein
LNLCLCPPTNEDIEEAQEWLLTGAGEVPSVITLACTVDGYERHRSVEALCEWAETKLALINSNRIASLSTQDLLDLLFYFNRAQRFVEGTFAAYASEIDKIIEVLAERVKECCANPPSK